MPEFQYAEPFPRAGKDETRYRKLTADHVAVGSFEGQEILKVAPAALTLLAREAFREISFFYRPRHLEQVAAILDDPEASPNDREVALALLRNAVISAEGKLPMCQDTGTATIVAWKGQRVWTGGGDAEALSRGVWETYTKEYLRYSQTVPLTMYEEKNSGTNLPAQIDILATDGDAYELLFVAKGGGSANKSMLYQETKALLNPASLERFMAEKMRTLGTAACPPYHLVFVIGGTSAEATMKTVKLASAGYLDDLPAAGNLHGQAFRDRELEARALELARETGIGAQFGGKHFALDVRVIRLPRHGASCPVGMGVSCSADRNVKARIDRDGVWLEELEHEPIRYLPEKYRTGVKSHGVPIDLNRPMPEILAELTKHPVSTPLLLTGPIVVARDIAHAKLKERLDRGEGLPQYVKDHPVYYAGPAKTPEGMASGSFGPTTAGRMDSYVDLFQSHGGSLVMIAKGNRSQQVTDACQKHGGFYLGSIGGPAALLAHESIRKVELLEYPELGMEAIYRIEVVDFPAFILVDDKGNDFFLKVALPVIS
ncbi:MAG: fumarate hydratase [Acidobacteria bacterium]|jgi:fumarate hydratase class I|nr:fumarate hydratase [Thermoanaerobaculia bacterium]MDI9631347.1 fumarate hydratase [Acidobacteriota bacterium]OQC40606.1 MAG: Fumarate hydratase class I, aerobic [Acidobacteria bacterium ADurb.Bin051]MBP7812865.1 fumarate hydratase [Thermoanaerobaculia bacterium]NLN10773.1 fumarate hydratase [Acidobacteriota bacterium]